MTKATLEKSELLDLYHKMVLARLVEEKIIDVVFCTQVTARAYVFNTRYEKQFVSDVTERVKESFREAGIRSAANNPLDTRLSREAA